MLIIYLLLINSFTFILMKYDKYKAKTKRSRVPEFTFFLLSLLGGFAGILFGAVVFNHKTNKRSFQVKIFIATFIFLGAGYFILT
ncbi:DUF1294 domain-containing protein [Erysipelothrix urinaevulpis]|uniref:DUF1294 domain-containing protein n=1 Tax=Erysipelothrix urinaevulpis TaxID=2683717 RepID=UPI0019163DBB|nr:DUF1294 domain-containing protein [Erysipelothrix urinaevulpis]